ncbi:MAG: hypothetical protein CMJ58_16420 [Planctomycetaceae bacterium]|nr:hypothetical protein [Planctomycetaceae bacterium]
MTRLTHSSKQRRLTAEGLEERRMMAGDVGVEMFGGVLMIDGDDLGNAVQVAKLNNGNLEIRGLSADGGLTRINGGFGAFTVPAANVRGMDINLGDGDDDLYLNTSAGTTGNRIYLADDLNVRMQGGDDFVKIQNMDIGGETDVRMDRDPSSSLAPIGFDFTGGDDRVEVYNSGLGDADFDMGDGDNEVKFGSFYTPYGYATWSSTDSLELTSGDGVDDFDLQNVFASDNLFFSMGGGNDTFDADGLRSYQGWTYVNGAAGRDDISLANVTTGRSLVLLGEEGSDEIAVTNGSVGEDMLIDTGDGNDVVAVENVDVAESLFADLGDGNDTLGLLRTTAASAELHGGRNTRFGQDSLTMTWSRFGSRTTTGWER